MAKTVKKTCVSCGRDVTTTVASKAPLCGECRGGPIPKEHDHSTRDIDQVRGLGLMFVDMESEEDELSEQQRIEDSYDE